MKSLFHQLAPRLAFAACALTTAAGGYAAYPDKPISIVVSYAPGQILGRRRLLARRSIESGRERQHPAPKAF
jgi:tripartite-type tricarboxylate transporter receptor subunit TctC